MLLTMSCVLVLEEMESHVLPRDKNSAYYVYGLSWVRTFIRLPVLIQG